MASQVFWRRALVEPGQIVAIEPDGTTHTAGDLLARVNQLTHGLRARGLRPGGQSWLSGLNVHIDSTNAIDFQNWFRTHDAPGPYPETFVIDGHRTHYLAFGAQWLRKGDMWVPAHTARNSPQAQRTSLYAWSLWAAAQDRLPEPVCGSTVTAAGLQAQVFGATASNPW